MKLPPYIQTALSVLGQNGFEAYVVGGCVRDALLGVIPHDWDVCTAASPEQILTAFSSYKTVPTGLQHGTVTVLIDDIPIEITTFRTDGEYRDHRHPDSVCFVENIEQDLSRRDFTVNAIAYHPDRGLVDPFCGAADLQKKLLRCVGDPHTRFNEDALRILRAMRFAATYGFTVEEETKRAALEHASLLRSVAAERVQAELKRMLVGTFVGSVLLELYPILFAVIPELKASQGVDQHSRYHNLDVLTHILTSVAHAVPDLTVRLAALLHDIGKPYCFMIDDEGNGHFYGHAHIGEQMATDILARLRFEKKLSEDVCTLIRYHDIPFEREDRTVRRWMNKLSPELFKKLLELKTADAKAHNPQMMDARFTEIDDIKARVDRTLEENACFSLRDLAVNGEDVISLGIPVGKGVGKCLQWALDEVIEQRVENNREELLESIRKHLDYFL